MAEQKSSALAMFVDSASALRLRNYRLTADLNAAKKSPLRPGRNHSGRVSSCPLRPPAAGRQGLQTVSGVLVVGREVVECGERLLDIWSSRTQMW